MASLHILKGNEQGNRLELETDTTILGRNRDCHVVIDFPAVSRQHAQILRIQGKFYIEDCNSRNKTFVNNQEINGRTQLKNNDRIKICDFLCTFLDGAQPKPLPADLVDQPEAEEEQDAGASSTVEASIGARLSTNQLFGSQPGEKLKAYLEISHSLSKTLELEALLPKITDSMFQLFRQGDRLFLIQREGESGKLVPKLIRTRRANTETSARFSRSIVQQCLDKAEALLSEDAASDSRFALSQSISDFRIRSVMCAPLMSADGKAFGVIQLDTQDRSKKFTEDDLGLLLGVAGQVAVALENAQLHQDLLARDRFQRDLDLARQVQRGFLPQELPKIPGYQFFAQYDAAQQVGGDYYDFIPLPDGRLAVLLGDVAGKGVPAALLMAKLSAEARFCVLTETLPAAAITKLNEYMLRAGMMDRFVTFAAAVLDPVKHRVTFVNAGHLTPLIYHSSSDKLEDATSSDTAGLPLGVLEGFEYASADVELASGDTLMIFTDGIPDAMSVQNKPFLTKGIQDAVQGVKTSPTMVVRPTDLGERLMKAVKQHSAGRSQHDDIALVCFGWAQAPAASPR